MNTAAPRKPTTPEEFLKGFFRRHPALKAHAPSKVVAKSGGSGAHGEARQHGSEIHLFPKFWELSPDTQDFVFAHEIGHFILSEFGLSKAIDVCKSLDIDPWDSDKLPFGQFNQDEAFADSFASYFLDGDVKRRYPPWASLVEVVLGKSKPAQRVAARFLVAADYFQIGNIVLYGRWKNHRGKIIRFDQDKYGNPIVEIEPIPKGRKSNKIMGLFKFWRADVKEKALAEQAAQKAKQEAEAATDNAMKLADRMDDEPDEDDNDDDWEG